MFKALVFWDRFHLAYRTGKQCDSLEGPRHDHDGSIWATTKGRVTGDPRLSQLRGIQKRVHPSATNYCIEDSPMELGAG